MSSSISVGATREEINRNLSPRQKQNVLDEAIKLSRALGRVAPQLCPECRKLIKEEVTDCL